ncbi:Na+/H+ antiporter subunit E [Desertihabitans brevis]|uniref:Na+/H+ antiporter subunit E n=1 Tax=Desertihabitans brevis TaxID=2268447 RepID=A0A367YVT8_9ACTN|nr:Na+/H+ antiporter subunit E [Desertihabitans brevis]RCK70005.1 Na+/H+ antiporter subunit E [Desertihabitans brevis]
MIRDRVQLVPVLLLTAVWTAMWGAVTPLVVVGGVVVSVLVLLVFPLPALTLGLRPRPWAVLVLAGAFVRDLLVGSAQVAWLAVRPGPPPGGSEVEVELHCDHDLLRTVTSQLTTLVPGTVVVDLAGRRMRLHAIAVHTDDERLEVAQRVLHTERRVMHAFGLQAPDASTPVTAKEVR